MSAVGVGLDYAFAPRLKMSTAAAATSGTVGSVQLYQYEVRQRPASFTRGLAAQFEAALCTRPHQLASMAASRSASRASRPLPLPHA